MLKSAHLTTKQMMILICFTAFGTIFFTLPRMLAQASGHSGWLSILLGGVMVIPTFWLITQIGSSMQEKSIIGYCLSLFGPVFGRVYALLFLLPVLFFSAFIVRILAEIIVSLVLPETPLELVIILLLILRYYLALGGMLSIARWGEIIAPVIVVLFVTMFALSMENVDLERIEPFFNASFMDIWKGALGICSTFSELIVLLYIYPQIKNKTHLFPALMWSMFMILCLFEVTFLITMGTYGNAFTQRLMFPIIELVKDISIFEFIEHLESPFLAVWIFINVTKGTLMFYACCVGSRDWFGTIDIGNLMIPISVIIFYISMIPDNIYASIISFEIAKGVTFCLYALVLLTILWLAGKMKARRTANGNTA